MSLNAPWFKRNCFNKFLVACLRNEPRFDFLEIALIFFLHAPEFLVFIKFKTFCYALAKPFHLFIKVKIEWVKAEFQSVGLYRYFGFIKVLIRLVLESYHRPKYKGAPSSTTGPIPPKPKSFNLEFEKDKIGLMKAKAF